MALKELVVIPSQCSATATCEACGAAFTCGATIAGCWCAEVKLSEAARATLRARYRSCLCRVCLENYAEVEARDGEKEEHVSTRAAH